ncbi:MAG: hypothetical protein HUU50_01055 [Candidatus Brocadiae bacterium]|nr:hypothetical protein [Candidatus Brocadiia bacterium]
MKIWEELRILETKRRKARSIQELLQGLEQIERRKKQLQEEREESSKQSTVQALKRKIELKLAQGKIQEAQDCFERIYHLAHELTEEESQSLISLWDKMEREKIRRDPTLSSLLNQMKMHIADRKIEKAQKIAEEIMEHGSYPMEEPAFFELLTELRELRRDEISAQCQSLQEKNEELRQKQEETESEITSHKRLSAGIVAYFYQKNPDLIPSPGRERIQFRLQEKAHSSYNSNHWENIIAIILDHYEECMEPFLKRMKE